MYDENELRVGGIEGWLVMTGWIVVYDMVRMYQGRPTMSEWFARISRTKMGIALNLFWIYKYLHLTRILPKRWDLFRQGGMLIERTRYDKIKTLPKQVPNGPHVIRG